MRKWRSETEKKKKKNLRKGREKLGGRGGEEYASDDIGVDDRNAVGLEEIGDGALARCDSTGQSHDSHSSSSFPIGFSCSVKLD